MVPVNVIVVSIKQFLKHPVPRDFKDAGNETVRTEDPKKTSLPIVISELPENWMLWIDDDLKTESETVVHSEGMATDVCAFSKYSNNFCLPLT